MTRLRLTAMGLSTLFGMARRGWFIPHRYAGSLPLPGTNPPYAPSQQMLERHEVRLRETAAVILSHSEALLAIAAESGRPAAGVPNPRFDQGWFATFDAAAAYALVRVRRPARIVEVGSGHSTRFMARALHDGDLPGRILSLDPAPRAAIEALAPRVELRRETVQQAGEAAFAALEEGDILFIDSSHILMPGSDVDFLFNRIMPALPRGVLVHIHDVFLPDDYPRQWAWRNYNEQQGVAPLLGTETWRPLFASHYMRSRRPDLVPSVVLDRLPRHPAAIDASLWLEKD